MVFMKKLFGSDSDTAAYLELPPGAFFKKLVEVEAAPENVSMSEAAWNHLVQPLYDHDKRFSGNRKLSEILYEAAKALHTAKRNGAIFEIIGEEVGNIPYSMAILEVFIDTGKDGNIFMEIGFAGERERKNRSGRSKSADKKPVYFMLNTLGERGNS